MADGADLADGDEQAVLLAVDVDLLDDLLVTGGFAFAPEFGAAAAPEVGAAGRER